jgi:hypothetical protein
MATTFVTYMGSFSLPTMLLLALFGGAVLYATLGSRQPEHYLIIAIIVATLAPYTLLPNHVTGYNAINWIPWMVAFMFVVLPISLPSQNMASWPSSGRSAVLGKISLVLLLALVAAVTLAQTQESRVEELKYFMKQSDINQNMVDDLLAHQKQLAAFDTIGVVGADRWSPWLKTQAEFLTDLGFNNRWLVFVPRLDFYHTQQAIDPFDPTTATLYYTGPVTYLRLADLEQNPDLPLLVFGDDGHVVSWATTAGDYFRECIDRSGERIAKKCRTNPDA